VGARLDQHLTELLRLNYAAVKQVIYGFERIDQLDAALAARLPSGTQLLPQSVDVSIPRRRGGGPQLVRVLHSHQHAERLSAAAALSLSALFLKLFLKHT